MRSHLGPEGPSLDPEIMTGARKRTLRPYRDPEVSSLDPEIFDWNPEAKWELGGTWGSSLDPEIFDWNPEAIGEPGGTVLRLLRQTTTEGAGVGVMIQVPGFASFHVWRSRVLIAPCSFDTILRLAHTHSCFMSHTHFAFVDVPLWSCHFLQGLARIGGLWRSDPAPCRRLLSAPRLPYRYGPEKDLWYSFSWEIQYLAACFLIFLASLQSSGRMSFSRYRTRGVIHVSPSSAAETSSDWGSSRVAGN
ncbi:hypothetical protein F2Q70_00022328 [Brassica cretica]|uniref:Uncharacterized protein n=1 Tax=Brassica cretica TaxID=69181 RepID=A0A8S9GT62_BRACR|nr:hypothetical protein F2Q70_00022328 [Brassica cretica]